jgi:hypothetical protein
MLKEYPTKQSRAEQNKRWFADDYFDIIFWLDRDSVISGFQLCYDKQRNERALTWIKGKGFRHDFIDGGEESPAKNRSPILMKDGDFPVAQVLDRFMTRSENMEQALKLFVINKFKSCQLL